MKKLLYIPLLTSFMLLLCSCSSFEPTMEVNDALAHVENKIVYHDREFMEEKDLRLPKYFNEENLGTLKYNFGFQQGTTGSNQTNTELDLNHFTPNEWNAFKREFENAVAGTKRFPIAQMLYGLADNELRKKTRNGVANAKEFDPSALKEAAGIFHLTPMRTYSWSLASKQKTNNYTLKLVVNPLAADNNSPLDGIQPFSVQIDCVIYQLTDRAGRVVKGLRLSDSSKQEELNVKLFRAAIVQFFNKMYNIFPVGGKIVNYEEGQFNLKVGRDSGVQPNMEFVVYAKKKGDADAMRIALYNATAESVGRNTTTLTSWRKSEKKNAAKIIKLLENDFAEAREEYDFYACSDGFAEWPDFIERSTPKKDE